MKYEWDENKRLSNIKKHGLDFIEACFIFEDINAIFYPDNRADCGETRLVAIGKIQNNEIAVVCYTLRTDITRIISFRYATKKEKEIYYGNSPIYR